MIRNAPTGDNDHRILFLLNDFSFSGSLKYSLSGPADRFRLPGGKGLAGGGICPPLLINVHLFEIKGFCFVFSLTCLYFFLDFQGLPTSPGSGRTCCLTVEASLVSESGLREPSSSDGLPALVTSDNGSRLVTEVPSVTELSM